MTGVVGWRLKSVRWAAGMASRLSAPDPDNLLLVGRTLVASQLPLGSLARYFGNLVKKLQRFDNLCTGFVEEQN